jgi:hypothetical protein
MKVVGLKELNYKARLQLIGLLELQREVNKLMVKSKIDSKLKERIDKYLIAANEELMDCINFLFEAENCNTENDLEFLLLIYDDKIAGDTI